MNGSYFSLSRKPVDRDVLLLLLDEADSDLKGCSDSRSLLFEISEYLLVFQIFSIAFKIFAQDFYSKFLSLIDSSINFFLVYRVDL